MTYVALYRWPAGEMSRTTSAVSLRRTADAVRITYRAFLDDLEVTTEHAFKPLGTDLQQERLNLQQQNSIRRPAECSSSIFAASRRELFKRS